MSAEPGSSLLYERAEKAARMIRVRAKVDPSVAIVLGSGLGAFADELKDATAILYDEIPGFARATVDIAGERYGNGGRVQRAVAESWSSVGLAVRVFDAPRIPIKRPAERRAPVRTLPKWRRRPAR